MTVNGSKPTVVEALSAVMADLPAIGKDSKAPEKMGGYPFRGIEAITRHLQPLLATHGVVIAPRTSITNVTQSPGMKEGWQDVYLSVEWLVTGPDGSTMTAQTTGIGRDNTDKGANKAQSQAFKYLLLQLFCIADAKDDSDGQSYEHDRVERIPEPLGDGWPGYKQRDDAWAALLAATSTLGDDASAEVKAWVKKQGIVYSAFSVENAADWQAAIDRLSPAGDESSDGHVPESVAASAGESAT